SKAVKEPRTVISVDMSPPYRQDGDHEQRRRRISHVRSAAAGLSATRLSGTGLSRRTGAALPVLSSTGRLPSARLPPARPPTARPWRAATGLRPSRWLSPARLPPAGLPPARIPGIRRTTGPEAGRHSVAAVEPVGHLQRRGGLHPRESQSDAGVDD